jgi:ATP-binding cassette, subfamily C (CFTR/MRP), member 1
VWTALVRAFGANWLKAGLIKLVHDCVNLSSPFFLRKLLQHIQNDGDQGTGLGWAVALFCCGTTTAILVNQYFVRVFNTALHLKSALIQYLYDKCLRLSLPAKAALGQGKVTNLQSNDAAKLFSLPQYGHVIWSGPFQVRLRRVSLQHRCSKQSRLPALAPALPAWICRCRGIILTALSLHL